MTSLQAHLETYSKEELRHYARSLGLSLSRSLKKADLAQAIAGELLREDTLRRRMGILTDEQIRLFERAAAEPCRPGETEMGDALRLHDLDYGIYSERDGLLRIPEDVALSYKKLSCRAFHHYRRRVAWLMKCLYFAELLFGVTPVDHLYASGVILPYLKSLQLEDLVIASPDVGGSKRANTYAKYLGCPLVLCNKTRARANVVSSMQIIGDVKDKNVVIIDDMVDTAGTITKAADIMKEAGAKTVRACASHCVMSGPASQRVQESALEEIVFTDSIPYNMNCKKVKQLSVADMFAETIRRVINNESISDQYIV